MNQTEPKEEKHHYGKEKIIVSVIFIYLLLLLSLYQALFGLLLQINHLIYMCWESE